LAVPFSANRFRHQKQNTDFGWRWASRYVSLRALCGFPFSLRPLRQD